MLTYFLICLLGLPLFLVDFAETGDPFALADLLGGVVRATIVPALVTENQSTTDGTSFATASVTPAANVLHLLCITGAHATAAETPNSVTGNGLTWTAVTNGSAPTSGGTRRVSWFYAWGAAPSAGAITIGFATTHTACAWSLIALPGAVLAAPRQATSNTANSTTVTGTLAALDSANSVHLYGLGRGATEASNPPATGGWAELSDRTYATPAGALEVAWAKNDTTADPTWTTSGQVVIVSVEAKAA